MKRMPHVAPPRLATLVTLACFCLPASPAAAYELLVRDYGAGQNAIRWATFPVTYRQNPASAPAGIPALVDAAFQTWTDLPSAQIEFVRGADTTAGGHTTDTLTTISYDDPLSQLDPGVLASASSSGAATHLFNASTYYTITQADIVFNDGIPFTDSQGASLTGGCIPGGLNAKYDAEAVALHEIGHLFGLAHPAGATYDSAIMYPAIADCDPDRTNPRPDDQDGVTFLYANGTPTIYPDFDLDMAIGYVPFDVAFTDETTGGIPATYAWSFGDGGTSTQAQPTHSYTAAGGFDIRLTVNGGVSVEKADSVMAFNAPEPDFSSDVVSGDPPLVVSFQNLTPDPSAVTWIWEFGDGTQASSVYEPVHTYQQEGYYTVTLKADAGAGRIEIVKEKYMKVGDPGAEACGCRLDPDPSRWKHASVLALLALGVIGLRRREGVASPVRRTAEQSGLIAATGWQRYQINRARDRLGWNSGEEV